MKLTTGSGQPRRRQRVQGMAAEPVEGGRRHPDRRHTRMDDRWDGDGLRRLQRLTNDSSTGAFTSRVQVADDEDRTRFSAPRPARSVRTRQTLDDSVAVTYTTLRLATAWMNFIPDAGMAKPDSPMQRPRGRRLGTATTEATMADFGQECPRERVEAASGTSARLYRWRRRRIHPASIRGECGTFPIPETPGRDPNQPPFPVIPPSRSLARHEIHRSRSRGTVRIWPAGNAVTANHRGAMTLMRIQ